MQIKVYTIEFKMPRWIRNSLVFIGIPMMVLLGIGAVVRAAVTVPNTFVGGTQISATKLNQNFKTLQDAVNAIEGKTPLSGLSLAVIEQKVSVPANDWRQFGVSCPSGTLLIGGGCRSYSPNIHLWENFIGMNGTIQYCAFFNSTPGAYSPSAFAYCLGNK